MPAKSSTIVTALTAAALAAIGVLGYQATASASGPLTPVRGQAKPAAERPAAREQHDKKDTPPAPAPVPEHSGTGKRVVYALGAKRVWLVGADGAAQRTFPVAPSAVSPAPGTYPVTSRSVSVTGSDGVAVEHVVVFATVNGAVVGFSAAVDGSTPAPGGANGKKTGGIRESRADGAALWDFAVRGVKVVVVP
ncbi:hypothetical protein ADL22_33165 [Streptomyces sp. NRRL F-4489]|uniref:hypothetical protein n=1 Tax=Streptomyces sp. NRRL F-4489 TaxID=1609095 RepID=UPI000748219D|nr:hypothetical protein [Streptomyces sp. NRRL F-4489]KUL33441.1 hypothetical protein ADL22_33165 [Streptomyces sp. NRRL F-4489]